VTRKVSVDSVGDTPADDLLRFLYDLGFRQRSAWGWVVAGAFAALPGWFALVSLIEGNTVSGTVFTTMCGLILGLRFYALRKMDLDAFGTRHATPTERATPIDIDA
jgi:hypothetical protein